MAIIAITTRPPETASNSSSRQFAQFVSCRGHDYLAPFGQRTAPSNRWCGHTGATLSPSTWDLVPQGPLKSDIS